MKQHESSLLLLTQPNNMTTQELAKFDAPKAIEAVKTKVLQYAGLKIENLEDKEGYEKVRVALSDCVSTRIEFVASCKEARDESTRYSKFVIEKEKEGVEEIKKIEDLLRAEKEKVDNEKERIKQEKEAKAQEELQLRINELAKYGYSHDLFDLRHMEFADYVNLCTLKELEWNNAEKLRIQEEERIQKEREDFEKRQVEVERKEKEQAEREAIIIAKEKAIEDKRLAEEREIELAKVRKEAEEKSRIETEARIAREQEEAQARKQKEADDIALAEKEQQAKLEKKKKYIAWLSENGYKED